MLTRDNASNRATFGFGIARSVYLVSVPIGGAAITELAPQTFYQGVHPTERLADDNHAGFEVRAVVDLLAPANTSGTLTVVGGWPESVAVSKAVTLTVGNNTVVVTIPASQTLAVKLWHPHGHGGQPRYAINATFEPSSSSVVARTGRRFNTIPPPPATTERLLGFRHAVLITINDSDPVAVAAAQSQNGSGTFTMFFRVNGAAVYARGANKVPMDLMEGRMTANAHRRLVYSASEAHFNTIRVRGFPSTWL
jgi:hypothetical protein